MLKIRTIALLTLLATPAVAEPCDAPVASVTPATPFERPPARYVAAHPGVGFVPVTLGGLFRACPEYATRGRYACAVPPDRVYYWCALRDLGAMREHELAHLPPTSWPPEHPR